MITEPEPKPEEEPEVEVKPILTFSDHEYKRLMHSDRITDAHRVFIKNCFENGEFVRI